jgi:hypothetical protein
VQEFCGGEEKIAASIAAMRLGRLTLILILPIAVRIKFDLAVNLPTDTSRIISLGDVAQLTSALQNLPEVLRWPTAVLFR